MKSGKSRKYGIFATKEIIFNYTHTYIKMMALLIISLILLTIFVSMYLLSNKYNSNKEKQLKLEKETKFKTRMEEIKKMKEELTNEQKQYSAAEIQDKNDNIVNQPEIRTNIVSSSNDKHEWAMKMAEIRKQKKQQREKEQQEWEIKKNELQQEMQKKWMALEASFKEIGISLVCTEALYNRNYFKLYAPENVDLDKLFLLIEQSYQITQSQHYGLNIYFSISEYCIVEANGKTLLKFFYNDGWHVYSFEQGKMIKKHLSKKQIEKFLYCYLESRKLKYLEILWSKIIENGLVGSAKLSVEGDLIEDKVYNALKSSNYDSMFNQSLECIFNKGLLVIDYALPEISKYPAIKEYKYVSSTNEINIKKQPENYISKEYEKALYSITLRTIYEAFYVDTKNEIKIVTFNGFISSINPSTGLMERKCILSIQVAKERFTQINILNVDPKSCFKSLKGVSAAKLITLSPINPILSFNKNDKRFIAERQVNTDQGTNLAAMHWEDFEQLVRELFELEFAQNGSEVKVTQASRDGGVDAIIFDPDPLRGGKIVIQAKRYTNTVGVSAVRDLYGTVINEGANTGILITTSDYGHDSYEFAKDKPLKLLNGGHLLALLLKNGRKAHINIEEAKRLNQIE